MHVLVATDGQLDPADVAGFATPLAGTDGRVTVLTVVELPRRLLSDLRSVMGEPSGVVVDTDAEYVDAPGVDVETPRNWPGDDAMVARYLEDKSAQYAGPIVAAVAERGCRASAIVREGENAAATILDAITELDADVVVIGAHGQGVFQGLLGSTGTKIVRRSSKPVLLIRG